MNLNEAKRVLRNYGYRLLDESRNYGVFVHSNNEERHHNLGGKGVKVINIVHS